MLVTIVTNIKPLPFQSSDWSTSVGLYPFRPITILPWEGHYVQAQRFFYLFERHAGWRHEPRYHWWSGQTVDARVIRSKWWYRSPMGVLVLSAMLLDFDQLNKSTIFICYSLLWPYEFHCYRTDLSASLSVCLTNLSQSLSVCLVVSLTELSESMLVCLTNLSQSLSVCLAVSLNALSESGCLSVCLAVSLTNLSEYQSIWLIYQSLCLSD